MERKCCFGKKKRKCIIDAGYNTLLLYTRKFEENLQACKTRRSGIFRRRQSHCWGFHNHEEDGASSDRHKKKKGGIFFPGPSFLQLIRFRQLQKFGRAKKKITFFFVYSSILLLCFCRNTHKAWLGIETDRYCQWLPWWTRWRPCIQHKRSPLEDAAATAWRK